MKHIFDKAVLGTQEAAPGQSLAFLRLPKALLDAGASYDGVLLVSELRSASGQRFYNSGLTDVMRNGAPMSRDAKSGDLKPWYNTPDDAKYFIIGSWSGGDTAVLDQTPEQAALYKELHALLTACRGLNVMRPLQARQRDYPAPHRPLYF